MNKSSERTEARNSYAKILFASDTTFIVSSFKRFKQLRARSLNSMGWRYHL